MLASLVFLAVAFGLLVAVPLMILTVFLKVALGLVLLPFKILGGALRLVLGLVGGVFKLLFGAMGLLAFAVAAVVFLIVLPLLPFLILGALVWGIFRLARGSSPVRVVA
jgi:hypothetical protein